MSNSIEVKGPKINDNVDLKYARDNLEYKENEGIFYWLSGKNKGKAAGTKTKAGYIRIQVCNELVFAHRLVWAFTYNEYPESYIDHIDHNRSNNKINNLRIVSMRGNARNAIMSKKNKSGINGVFWCKRGMKWTVQIMADGCKKHIGYFTNIDDAAIARKEANKKYNYSETHGDTYES